MKYELDVAIIGGGPAGFTAGIYASRANLKTAIFEGPTPGGQLTITTDIENFPGFPNGISGTELTNQMREQANKFGAESINETIVKVDFSNRPFVMETDSENQIIAKSVIISTGACAQLLNAKGEKEYFGFGISACATCDGFFYRNREIMVVGGGDTAMEEAEYLTKFASKVTLVHRREEFRASKIMVDRVKKNPKIEYLLNSVIDEYKGEKKNFMQSLTSVVIKNTKTEELTEHKIDGVFIAIGHKPNTDLFKGILDMSDSGYLITQGKSSYTNIPGVFACGDVQDSTYRQAITAAGSGCSASIDAERWLEDNG